MICLACPMLKPVVTPCRSFSCCLRRAGLLLVACSHIFCQSCIEDHMQKSSECPLCKRCILHSSEAANDEPEYAHLSRITSQCAFHESANAKYAFVTVVAALIVGWWFAAEGTNVTVTPHSVIFLFLAALGLAVAHATGFGVNRILVASFVVAVWLTTKQTNGFGWIEVLAKGGAC